MNERPLPTITQGEVRDAGLLWRWLVRLPDMIPGVQTFEVDFNPAPISASSESVQTIAIAGVTTEDIIVVNKPTNTTGLDLIHSWVEAADVVKVKFRNHTGSPISPGSEVYKVMAVRL